jgi:hypothetical protein
MNLDFEAMHDISQQLSIGTEYGTWNSTRGYSEQDLTNLRRDAVIALFETDLGEELREKCGPDIGERVLEVFAERYDGKFPSTHPFYEYLLEVAEDLLRTEAREFEPPKAAPIPKPASVAVIPPPKISKEAAQMAHMVSKQIIRDGVSSLKARCGVVTVVAEDGHSYQYPSDSFENLYEEAVKFGALPPVGGVR